jgi:hypothetical protein
MFYDGEPIWPPKWLWAGRGQNERPVGEVGILEDVYVSISDPNSTDSVATFSRVYLFIEYRGSSYLGCLPFADPADCRQIADLLSPLCGTTLKEIGKIDLASALPTNS